LVMERFAIKRDRAGISRMNPEDRLCHIGPARADQSGDAENLAAPHLEAHVRKAPFTAEVLHAQAWLADLGLRLVKKFSEFASDHHADDFFGAGVSDISRADAVTVAQNGDAIRDREDFFQAMADKHD